MKLVEVTSAKRVFEECGKECEFCNPAGTTANDERVSAIVGIAIVGIVALALAIPGFQMIQQGIITFRVIVVMLLCVLVCSACWTGIVVFLFKERQKARKRVIRYEFNLVERTVRIDDTARQGKPMIISPHTFGPFTIEFKSPCYRIQLLPSQYVIWSRSEPPPEQFVSTLVAIGMPKEEHNTGKS